MALTLLLSATLVSSCTVSDQVSSSESPSIDISDYLNVTAEVDYDAGQFRFPIDDYLMSTDEIAKVRMANEVQFAACMSEQGGFYEPLSEVEYTFAMADRRYGLWDVQEASIYGYEVSQPIQPTPSFPPSIDSATNDKAYAECLDLVSELPIVTRGTYPETPDQATAFIGPMIMRTAYAAAQLDQRWLQEDEDLFRCLESAGYVVDEEIYGPELTGDKEEDRLGAIAAATCSQSTNRVQDLSTIESQYQAALIDQNGLELEKSNSLHESIISQAEEILSRG